MGLARKLAFTCTTLILAFLLLEAAVRLTNYDQKWMINLYEKGGALPGVQIPDSYLLWRNRPGAKLTWTPERLNARGYRGPAPSASKGAGVLRIAVLGDSCTFGIVQTSATRFQTPTPYSQLLQELLDANMPRYKFEVLNYGVIGYTSFHGLRLMRREVARDDPDLVVIRFGWNDHLLSSYGRSFSSPRNAVFEKIEDLLYRSRLVAMLLFPRKPAAGEPAIAQPISADPAVWVTPDDYAFNLGRMIDLARALRARPILVDAPAAPMVPSLRPIGNWFAEVAGYPSFERLLEVHADYQAITERVAREKGVPFVKTAVTYLGAKSRPMFTGYDIAHPSQAGHARIANRLYAEIALQVARMNAASD